MVAIAVEPRAVNSEIVSLSEVRFAWPGRDAFALSIKRFVLPARERLLLIGPSGSGKSTFLGLICGILTPQSGRIDILGTNIAAMSAAARDRYRAEHFGIVFQMFNLLPYGTVIDNVLLPLSFAPERCRRVTARGPGEAEAQRLLTRLGLDAARVRRLTAAQLSVGQQQRVAVARALIGAPELIVADEPTSALDRNRQAAFLDLLFGEMSEAGATLIMVSHDESLAPRFDRVLRLDEIATSEESDRA
ncbi:MAG TPA: ABC transporter ATP-binding protein [Hyphomicrobiaceae bacterium]|nr:ABC transporter ATP-binding protein [Hyphomicrobiaceae bacterium]